MEKGNKMVEYVNIENLIEKLGIAECRNCKFGGTYCADCKFIDAHAILDALDDICTEALCQTYAGEEHSNRTHQTLGKT